MLRYSLNLCCIICIVLAVVQGANTVLFAQNLPPSGSSPSTPFLAVPTGPTIPPEPSSNYGAGTNYSETNARATSSGFVSAPAPSSPAGPVPGAMPYSTLSPSPEPTSAAPLLGSPSPGANSTSSANSYLPISLEPEKTMYFEEAWTWQLLPDGLLYKSYLAGGREPRFASQWINEKNTGWLWDVTLGGRVGILRYGTTNSPWPEGWQLDIEGAAFPRLNLDQARDLDAVDFRFGIP